MSDFWEMFRLVLDERKRREVDPTLAMLGECLAEADKGADRHTQKRLRELHRFFSTTTAWYAQLRQWLAATLAKFASTGEKAWKMSGG